MAGLKGVGGGGKGGEGDGTTKDMLNVKVRPETAEFGEMIDIVIVDPDAT